jgi:hypothetical protein
MNSESNILNTKFVKAIYCSSPQRDEYEVKNLVETAENEPHNNLFK